jgi:hypothetical protein
MKYFTIKELCVSGSHPSLVEIPKPGTSIYNNLVKLVEKLLDPIREKLNQPITVTSGYRSEKLNNAVGGSKTSAHRLGLAADIHTGNNSSDNLKIVSTILEHNIDFDQIIIEYPTFNTLGNIISAKWIHVGLSKTTNRKQILYYYNKKYYPVKVLKNFLFKK